VVGMACFELAGCSFYVHSRFFWEGEMVFGTLELAVVSRARSYGG
jgi:hypothetical protein